MPLLAEEALRKAMQALFENYGSPQIEYYPRLIVLPPPTPEKNKLLIDLYEDVSEQDRLNPDVDPKKKLEDECNRITSDTQTTESIGKVPSAPSAATSLPVSKK